jgi:F-type H+-transporting ATPase subunit b
MELVTPGIGLIFWMTLTFLILLWILGKFAWKPILNMLKERENSIQEALDSAEKVKEEMKKLQAGNEKLLKEAQEEKNKILIEARQIKDSIVEEARSKANEEGAKIIESARKSIEVEKMAAITELKNQLATFSIEVAEKILEKELSKDKEQKELINKWVDGVKFN